MRKGSQPVWGVLPSQVPVWITGQSPADELAVIKEYMPQIYPASGVRGLRYLYTKSHQALVGAGKRCQSYSGFCLSCSAWRQGAHKALR